MQSTDADGNALGGIRHPLITAPCALLGKPFHRVDCPRDFAVGPNLPTRSPERRSLVLFPCRSGVHWTLRWREMDSNYWYRGTKAVDFPADHRAAGEVRLAARRLLATRWPSLLPACCSSAWARRCRGQPALFPALRRLRRRNEHREWRRDPARDAWHRLRNKAGATRPFGHPCRRLIIAVRLHDTLRADDG